MSIFVFVEWFLRAFGLFWIIGGIVALRQAQQAALMDSVLDALGAPEDPLVTRFLTVGAVLTLMSGAALAVASPWSSLVVGVLVLSQVIYFALKYRRQQQATTDEARADAAVAPSTRRAFVLSVIIWGLCLWIFPPAGFAAAEYQTYCNERFGFCVDYPADAEVDPAPAR